MHRCDHNDCFTCPYTDCISDVGPRNSRKKRKKQSRAEVNARYYYKNRERIAESRKKIYKDKEHKT